MDDTSSNHTRVLQAHDLTGEMVDVVIVGSQGGRVKRKFSDPYFYGFLPGVLELAKNPTVTGFDFRVMLVLTTMATLDGSAWPTESGRIAEILGVKARSQVNESLNRLVAAGVITRPSYGRVAFTGSVIWRGYSTVRESVKGSAE